MEKINSLTVLGKRRKGLEWLYFILLVAGVGLVALVQTKKSYTIFTTLLASIPGIICIGVSIFLLIDYYNTPKNAITYDGQGTIYVKNQAIEISDIIDVSYKNPPAMYSVKPSIWGQIIISTKLGFFKIKYVDECEMVQKTIIRLTYEKTNNSKQLKEYNNDFLI